MTIYKRVLTSLLLLAIILTSLMPWAPNATAQGVVGCAIDARGASIGDLGQVLPGGTGFPVLDQGIQTDVAELQNRFGVYAKMFLMRERGGGNAFALSTRHNAHSQILRQFGIPPQFSPDGVVIFGVNLMTSEFNSAHRSGYGIPAIIAHEYAHITQFKRGVPFGGKWIELHADYMAGWFTAHRGRYFPQNAEESAASFFNKGDYSFNDPSHHGTPQERLNAFMAGFRLNWPGNVADANVVYQEGIRYMQSLGAR